MKIKLKRGLIYNGVMYKAGETLELDGELGYSFSWLKSGGFVDDAQEVNPTEELDDGLLAADGLPPLDEEPNKRRKKNV